MVKPLTRACPTPFPPEPLAPRDTFGSCWTEAMRHICDLTTKLNKYRKHNAELLQERDEAMKGRDQAVMERDGLARGVAGASRHGTGGRALPQPSPSLGFQFNSDESTAKRI